MVILIIIIISILTTLVIYRKKINHKDEFIQDYFYNMENNEVILELIKNVPNEISITIVWDYKYSNSFIKLEEYSYKLLGFAINLFENDELNLNEKQIIAYAIQNVEIGIYKYFLKDLAISFNNGNIEEYLVDHCLFPRDNWGHMVIKYYRDPIIREALNIILESNESSPQLKNLVQLTLKGTLWQNMRANI